MEKLSREEIAKSEVGNTAISRGNSIVLAFIFLLAVFFVPLGQFIYDRVGGHEIWPGFVSAKAGEGNRSFESVSTQNIVILENIDLIETHLEDKSFLKQLLLPPLQYFSLRYLHQGNEKVVVGDDGWLFYRPGLDYMIGQPFLEDAQLQRRIDGHELWEQEIQADPLPAILGFHRQLQERGITLILVPVPIKPSIHPEKLTPNVPEIIGGNRSFESFKEALVRKGVLVFDARKILSAYAGEKEAAFLNRDTHWTPGAMERVAMGLSDFVKENITTLAAGNSSFKRQRQNIAYTGDIAKMLTLPDGATVFDEQQYESRLVLTQTDEFWQPDRQAEVLLLGDSFTNIYSSASLGWGSGAGFGEQLSYCLARPLDLIVRNDSGAYITRDILAADLARGRDRLENKKVVIWEFAERELGLGNWKQISLELGESWESSDFFTVSAGAEQRVTGILESVSRSPRPGTVPYRDNIVTMHLVDIVAEDGEAPGQALVYGFGMRDNVMTPLGNLRPGAKISLVLSRWEDREMEYGSYRRSPLDDEMMELELPNWGELIDDE